MNPAPHALRASRLDPAAEGAPASAVVPVRVIDGKYELVQRVGRGAMGVVYEARHLGTGRPVAVKVLVTDPSDNGDRVARFRREAMAAGAIESRHIAQVLDVGFDPDSRSPYLVMELLRGEDLQCVLHRIGPLASHAATRIVAQACLGLQKAHERGVVHRDIKPANLFVARSDEGACVVKVLDFGVAKLPKGVSSATRGGPRGAAQGVARPLESANLTHAGMLMGSPKYVSPEQVRAHETVDHRSDLWSLGVVFYELLSGVPPHADATNLGDLLVRICSEPVRPIRELVPWVSDEVAAIVGRALALDPADRFGSAREMYDALRAALPNGHELTEAMIAPSAKSKSRILVLKTLRLAAARAAASVPRYSSSPESGSGSMGPVQVARGHARPIVLQGAGASPSPSSDDIARSVVGSLAPVAVPRAKGVARRVLAVAAVAVLVAALIPIVPWALRVHRGHGAARSPAPRSTIDR